MAHFPRVRSLLAIATAATAFAGTTAAQARRIEIDKREVVADGKRFGEVGAYEVIEGRLVFGLDPDLPQNRRITDLDRAPRNANGHVEATADLVVLQPVDPDRRAGVALLEVSNRGGKASLSYFNRGGRGNVSRAASFGDGLLMRMGLTVIWVGWQWDVPDQPGRLRLRVPRANGIKGRARADWTVDRGTDRLELAHRNHRAYPALDDPDNVFTRRPGRDAAREIVSKDTYSVSEDRTALVCEEGFEPGYIYEFVYRVEDPAVVGMGLAAIRDTIAYAKHDPECPFPVKQGVAVGISQTGRFLRHYLYQGFNTDTEGRPALDGIMALTAGAGRGSFNHRFGQPSRDAHRYSAFFYPTDIYPFTSQLQEDPVTGRMDGLLAHQWDPDHLPRTFFVNTGYEYWGRAAALLHVDSMGARDVGPTARERIYHIASAQHFPGSLRRGNPMDLRTAYRAQLVAMVEWVRDGKAPPPSAYPRLSDGGLVRLGEGRTFPLPKRLVGWQGVTWPTQPHVAYRADYGDRWPQGVVRHQPPRLGRPFPALVPAVDEDGNERGGWRTLELRVPVGTYLPWSIRRGLPGGNGELADFVGGYVPFSYGLLEDDPRRTLGERYGDEEFFERKVRQAAQRMVAERMLLAEDVEHAVRHSLTLFRAAMR